MHKATLVDEGETFWFASLDGQEWLPVNREPTDDDASAVRGLLDGIINGQRQGSVPLRFARRFLQYRGATFVEAS